MEEALSDVYLDIRQEAYSAGLNEGTKKRRTDHWLQYAVLGGIAGLFVTFSIFGWPWAGGESDCLREEPVGGPEDGTVCVWTKADQAELDQQGAYDSGYDSGYEKGFRDGHEQLVDPCAFWTRKRDEAVEWRDRFADSSTSAPGTPDFLGSFRQQDIDEAEAEMAKVC
jgi:hypothetical protein